MAKEKRLILRTHANQLFEKIRNLDLDPSDFEWAESVSKTSPSSLIVSSLIHKPTGYYYLFDYRAEGHYCEYSPGDDKVVSKKFPGTWKFQFEYAGKWLEALKAETEAPDLWASLAQEKELLAAASDARDDNTPFSQDEKDYISRGLREIQEFIVSTHQLEGERLTFIETRLEYLLQSADRLGRKDWKNVALAVFFSIVLFFALPPAAAGELFRFVSATLHAVLGEGKFLP